MSKQKQYQKAWVLKCQILGLCPSCGKKNERQTKFCNACNSKSLKWHKDTHEENRIKVYDAYGNKCACCGEDIWMFLNVDHINNDGSNHRLVVGGSLASKAGSYKMYRWIIDHNYPSDFQLLCFNCNQGKYRNGGVCPHKGTNAIQ